MSRNSVYGYSIADIDQHDPQSATQMPADGTPPDARTVPVAHADPTVSMESTASSAKGPGTLRPVVDAVAVDICAPDVEVLTGPVG